jgi:hypothetical protein
MMACICWSSAAAFSALAQLWMAMVEYTSSTSSASTQQMMQV